MKERFVSGRADRRADLAATVTNTPAITTVGAPRTLRTLHKSLSCGVGKKGSSVEKRARNPQTAQIHSRPVNCVDREQDVDECPRAVADAIASVSGFPRRRDRWTG